MVVVVVGGRVVVATLGTVVLGVPAPVPSARAETREVPDVAEADGTDFGTVVVVVVVVVGAAEMLERVPAAGAAPAGRLVSLVPLRRAAILDKNFPCPSRNRCAERGRRRRR